jgi:hypothetical protein
MWTWPEFDSRLDHFLNSFFAVFFCVYEDCMHHSRLDCQKINAQEQKRARARVTQSPCEMTAAVVRTSIAASQVPDEILHNKALNDAIATLPSNYNFELHKVVRECQCCHLCVLICVCVLLDLANFTRKCEMCRTAVPRRLAGVRVRDLGHLECVHWCRDHHYGRRYVRCLLC